MKNTSSDLPQPTDQKAGCITYGIGGASFIPLFGVLFGIISIVIGIVKKIPMLIFLGVGGILVSVLLYGSLFYFGFYQRGGIYDNLRKRLAITMLNGAVKEIEYFKIQNGHYPKRINELETKKAESFPVIVDPTFVERKSPADSYFYYRLDDSGLSYYLRSVGADGLPFTADDIVPAIPENERIKTGLKLVQ